MLNTRLHVSPYQRRHRSALLDLTWTSLWNHKHLDWHKTSDWVDQDDNFIALAWHDDRLVGYLGLSRPEDGSSWIRLLVIRNGEMPAPIINELWRNAEAHCRQSRISRVVVLMSNNWCGNYLAQQGFDYYDDLITFSHIRTLPEQVSPAPVKVYPAEAEHVSAIAGIDQLAFKPPWRMAASDLRQACRVTAYSTVAELEGEIVGYQISTRHQDVAHLARLAVHPAHQGKRIGGALLSQLIASLDRPGIETLSVNTQLSNLPSQRLYRRYGFVRSGFDFEVWHKRLS